MARFAKLGLGGHGAFDAKTLSPELRTAVQQGMEDAWNTFKEFKETQLDTGKRTSADAFGTREYLNGSYIDRMSAAVLGIYGNSKDEAIYPVYFVDDTKKSLSGANRYTLRLAPDQLPPVNAFWSLTLYELPSSLLSANRLNRYLINSPMLPDLKRDVDGGLTLYVQHDTPGAGKEANWLPAPSGPFFMVCASPGPSRKPSMVVGKRPRSIRLWQGSRSMKARSLVFATALSVAAAVGGQAHAQSPSAPIPVTVDNFIRAESDLYLGNIVKDGGFGKFLHRREPSAIDNQTVIRLNRETLYSAAIFDLDAGPVTVTLPDAGKRFMSMQVINEDHYVPAVFYGAGPHTLTREQIGTRYVAVAIRTLVDPADPKDIAEVHALQDAIKVSQKSPGKFEIPSWDPASQKKVRDALLVLGATLPDFKKAFGTREQVDPIRHLIGRAAAWGGNPDRDATYLNITPAKNDGKPRSTA